MSEYHFPYPPPFYYPPQQQPQQPVDPIGEIIRQRENLDRMERFFKEHKKDEKPKKPEGLSKGQIFWLMIMFTPVIGPAVAFVYISGLNFMLHMVQNVIK